MARAPEPAVAALRRTSIRMPPAAIQAISSHGDRLGRVRAATRRITAAAERQTERSARTWHVLIALDRIAPVILVIHRPDALFYAGATRSAMRASECARETGSDGNGRAGNIEDSQSERIMTLRGDEKDVEAGAGRGSDGRWGRKA